VDIAFTGWVQCNGADCDAMQNEYGPTAGWMTYSEQFGHKVMLAVDGNSYADRFVDFLASGSLTLMTTIFVQWFHGGGGVWLEPGKHYIPVKLDYSDLAEKLDWVKAHPQEVTKMVEEARAFALSRLRKEDQNCYTWRLLIEYESLLVK
jgi:hypothetical protein